MWFIFQIYVSKEHLQRVWLVNRGCLLLRTPGPVPFETCMCSYVEIILSWTCHVSELWISNIPQYFYFVFRTIQLTSESSASLYCNTRTPCLTSHWYLSTRRQKKYYLKCSYQMTKIHNVMHLYEYKHKVNELLSLFNKYWCYILSQFIYFIVCNILTNTIPQVPSQ